jgi:hypothetical protein
MDLRAGRRSGHVVGLLSDATEYDAASTGSRHPRVIKGGTMPEVVIKGLTSADDAFWLPNVGVVFSEPRANRIVRLDEHDQPVTLVGNLHGPLGMTYDAKNGRLISLQTEPGFTGPRVVWPAGKEAIIADNYQGKPFGGPPQHPRLTTPTVPSGRVAVDVWFAAAEHAAQEEANDKKKAPAGGGRWRYQN